MTGLWITLAVVTVLGLLVTLLVVAGQAEDHWDAEMDAGFGRPDLPQRSPGHTGTEQTDEWLERLYDTPNHRPDHDTHGGTQ